MENIWIWACLWMLLGVFNVLFLSILYRILEKQGSSVKNPSMAMTIYFWAGAIGTVILVAAIVIVGIDTFVEKFIE